MSFFSIVLVFVIIIFLFLFPGMVIHRLCSGIRTCCVIVVFVGQVTKIVTFRQLAEHPAVFDHLSRSNVHNVVLV